MFDSAVHHVVEHASLAVVPVSTRRWLELHGKHPVCPSRDLAGFGRSDHDRPREGAMCADVLVRGCDSVEFLVEGYAEIAQPFGDELLTSGSCSPTPPVMTSRSSPQQWPS